MGTRIAFALLLVASVGCKEDEPKPVDASVIDSDPTIDAPPPVCGMGDVGYLENCTVGTTDCGSCECHSFGHTIVCTQTCTGDGDCPAPSAGCTGGYCRR